MRYSRSLSSMRRKPLGARVMHYSYHIVMAGLAAVAEASAAE
jgi:hypothetical protein